MMDAVGNEVVRLQRIAIGGLNLSELNIAEGQFKEVSKEFVLEKLQKKQEN